MKKKVRSIISRRSNQIRKVFSPLPLEIEEEKQPVSEDMIQIEKEIHEFQMILREKEEKITKLHDYQKGLEETCLFAEEFVERGRSENIVCSSI